MARIDDVIYYLDEYVEKAKKSEEVEKLNEHIALLRKAKNEIEEAFKTKFANIDKSDYKFFVDRISLIKDVDPEYEDILKQVVRCLATNFDMEIRSIEIEKEKLRNVVKEFEQTISMYHRRVATLKESQNLELANLIQRVVLRKVNGEYRLSGNITKEEYNSIIGLLDKLNIPIEDRIEFIRELNDAIANFKYRKEQLISKIEEENNTTKLDMLRGKSKTEPTVYSPKRGMADYNYKRINRVIKSLQDDYKEELENGYTSNVITKDTPITRDRLRLYYIGDTKEFDFKLVLYDLLNFINPANLEEMYNSNQINGEQLDIIRSIIYKKIIDKHEQMIKKKTMQQLSTPAKSELTEEEMLKQATQQVIPETTPVSTPVPVQPVKPTELPEQPKVPGVEAKPYENEKVQYLTPEETELIEDALEKANKYEYDFRQSTKLSDNVIKSCMDEHLADYYKVEYQTILIILKETPALKANYDEYVRFYKQIKYDKSLSDDENLVLLDEVKADLLADAQALIDRMETYIIEIIDTPPENELVELDDFQNNIIVLAQDIRDKSSILFEDCQEIQATGQIKISLVGDGFKKLENIDTIHPRTPLLESAKCKAKWIEKEYNPYRCRLGDLRYVYININICEENLKELQEAYEIQSKNLRLLYIPMVAYKKSDETVYALAENRIKNTCGDSADEINTIEWIKGIFNRPFTEETRQIAFDLINNSQKIIEKVKVGDLDNVPRPQ